MLRQLTAVVGGSIGNDPYGAGTWSGSARYLFAELERQSLLARRLGGDINKFWRYTLLAKHFSRDRKLWRSRYYADHHYRNSLTKCLVRKIGPESVQNDFLQIGAMFNLSQGLKGRARCFSYHDGNLAQSLRAGQVPKALSKSAIKQALAYEKTVYQSMDVVFAMSEYLRQSFINDFGVNGSKVVNVGGGVNLETFPDALPDKDYATKEILFVGVQFERKGGPDLLKAFRAVVDKHPESRLHIVGPKDVDIPTSLRKNVVVHGFLSKHDALGQAQIGNLYRRSCLFAMPSTYEPFGIAPLEAMAHQIPAIVTNSWALKEMVRPGENGDLVERGDVQDLADKLLHYIGQPDLLHTMGERGRQRVLERYTWASVVRRMKSKIWNVENG